MIHLIFSFLVFIHPIYISSTNVVVSDEILEIKIKLFRDDLEDGLRDFHGFSISIDSLNKIEKNKSLINQYINDKLNLILGVRLDSFEIDVVDNKNGSTSSRKDEELSPRAGIVYKPQDNISFSN